MQELWVLYSVWDASSLGDTDIEIYPDEFSAKKRRAELMYAALSEKCPLLAAFFNHSYSFDTQVEIYTFWWSTQEGKYTHPEYLIRQEKLKPAFVIST